MVDLDKLSYDEIQEIKSQIKKIEQTKTKHFAVSFDIRIRLDRDDSMYEAEVLEERILNILDFELELSRTERIGNLEVAEIYEVKL